jgi:alkylation response protein AidB-like acyl-CoA dehydrogenase
MKEIPHPSAFIDPAVSDIIRESSLKADQMGTLHPNQLVAIYGQKWFNLFVPKEFNGLELSFPGALEIQEGIAWTDGSTGWTVTLCSGANWFIGFLQPEVVKDIFNNDKTCFAGSGHPSGVAKITSQGYEITGFWKYATGAPYATAFTANCIIEKNGNALQNEDGSPMIRSFLFLRNEVTVHNDWKSIGMIATASNSFEVNKLYVPQNRCFIIHPGRVFLDHPIYQFPFLQFAEATLAVNSSGMSCRFLDLCEIILKEKAEYKNYATGSLKLLQQKLNGAKTNLQEARESFYVAVQSAWEECTSRRSVSPEQLNKLSVKSRELALFSRRLVDELYPYCGMIAINPETEINRVWRNLHTASQHGLLNYRD